MAPAQAYIDGGSAHLLVQGLIAAVVGVLYYVKNPREIWKAIRRRWKRDSSEPAQLSGTPADGWRMTVSASSGTSPPKRALRSRPCWRVACMPGSSNRGDLIPGSWTGPDQLGHPRIARYPPMPLSGPQPCWPMRRG